MEEVLKMDTKITLLHNTTILHLRQHSSGLMMQTGDIFFNLNDNQGCSSNLTCFCVIFGIIIMSYFNSK